MKYGQKRSSGMNGDEDGMVMKTMMMDERSGSAPVHSGRAETRMAGKGSSDRRTGCR